MANKYIPPQFAGNLVLLDESTTGITDTLVSPPSGRWVAAHNVHDSAVNILVPENEVLRYIAEDGDARSDVHGPGNSGKLDEDQSILSSATSTETSATGSFSGDSSGVVTVTRDGVVNPAGVTAPSFDGIDYDGDALTAIVVTSTEGVGLKEGDIISFPCTTNTGLTVTITVAEDDLQLAAGFYALKVTTRKLVHVLAAGDIMYFNNSKIEIQAADSGNDAKVICYFG